MKVNSININTNFKGRVYYKNPDKAEKELNKLYDTKAGAIAPQFIDEFAKCKKKIEAMTPDNFNSVFDIKFHKPMGFSSNPAYYYKVKFTKGEDDLDKYARKIIVPYHSYMGISTQEAIARTLDNFAKDVVMIGNPREDSYEAIQKYSNKANSKTLAQIIYENLDPQLPNGKVEYASMADIANFIELNSKQECFTAKKVDTFVKAFNAFKSKIEKETPDSFDCLVIPEDKSIVVLCYDSEQKDQCKFKQKICLDVDDYRKPYSLGYDLEKFYSYIHSSMDNLSNCIVEYANSLGDRREASKLQYATDYKKL